jgi:glycosyltransferase involved in cell wall biosynthesis
MLSAGPERRRELGKAARLRVQEGYSIQNIIRKYEELYLSLK